MPLAQQHDRTFARVMVGPAVTVLFLVTIGPLLFSFVVSFTNLQFSTPQPMRWVGIDNYISLLFNDSRFLSSMARTLVFVLAGVVTQTLLGYFIASLLLHVQRFRAFLLGPILIPSVISSVVAGWQGRMIFNASYGPLNDVLAHIGIKGPAWLALPQTALISVFLTDTWQWTPFLALIILAALQSQPQELLEAARLDGCGNSGKPLWLCAEFLPVLACSGAHRHSVLFQRSGQYPSQSILWALTYHGRLLGFQEHARPKYFRGVQHPVPSGVF